jgi:hypothetical protein
MFVIRRLLGYRFRLERRGKNFGTVVIARCLPLRRLHTGSADLDWQTMEHQPEK